MLASVCACGAIPPPTPTTANRGPAVVEPPPPPALNLPGTIALLPASDLESIEYARRLHRSIHELWGFGYLLYLGDQEVAEKRAPDRTLEAMVELVIAPDGSVRRATLLASSRLVVYDVAAIDTVLSAGPYPPPPPALHSMDGDTRLAWPFRRDERQCGTADVRVYRVLDQAAWTKARGPQGQEWDELAQKVLEVGASKRRARSPTPSP